MPDTLMDMFWPVVILVGAGTLLLRFSFIYAIDKIRMPPALQKMLRFIPASVLTAMLVPGVILHQGGVEVLAGKERILAALVAAAVAWKTKNMLLTILVAMGVLWLLQWLL